jgi:hypothetical protein
MGSIQRISISHQGIGLRSFVDWKIPSPFRGRPGGGLFLSGGYEMNHQAQFNNITQLKDYNNWQQSGLNRIK